MRSKKTKIVLLFGGRSAEHDVSLISASAIHANLDKDKYEVAAIYISKTGEWRTVDPPVFSRESLEKGLFSSFLPWQAASFSRNFEADIYFPVLHGPSGEDGTIQGLLELSDIPYVGAGVLGSAIGMDKAVMKAIFMTKNIPIVRSVVLMEIEWTAQKKAVLARIRKEFNLPFFVKPSNLGSSVGITKVSDYARTSSAVQQAFLYDRKILVEEGIKGREIECSVLGNENPRASLPGEVIPSRDFYDYRDKYLEGKTSFKIPVSLPPPLTSEIQRLSIEAFKAIEGSGMARVDFFLEDKTEKIFVNEVNTIPGFTEISMYPKLWEVSGLPFPSLLDELVELGFARHRAKKKCLERSP